MNIGSYLRDKLLNECIGATAFTPAATLELRLFSTTLSAAGTGTELTGDGYAPLAVANNTTNFPTSTSGTKENAVQLDFEIAEEDWTPILAIGLFDTSDNLYFYENYSEAIEVLETQYFFLAIGDIQIQFS